MKTNIAHEFKNGRFGMGHYALVEYSGVKSSGSIEIGPYASNFAATQAATAIKAQVTA